MFICMVDWFSRCRLVTENVMANALEEEMFSVSDPARLEDGSEVRSLDSVVAYGVGHFSTCYISRYQFALLLLLVDSLQVAPYIGLEYSTI